MISLDENKREDFFLYFCDIFIRRYLLTTLALRCCYDTMPTTTEKCWNTFKKKNWDNCKGVLDLSFIFFFISWFFSQPPTRLPPSPHPVAEICSELLIFFGVLAISYLQIFIHPCTIHIRMLVFLRIEEKEDKKKEFHHVGAEINFALEINREDDSRKINAANGNKWAPVFARAPEHSDPSQCITSNC